MAEQGLNERTHGTVLHGERETRQAIKRLAELTVMTYADKPKPLFVALLRGALPFAVEFMRAIVQTDPTFHPEMDTMTVSTYGAEREPKTPEIIMDIDPRKTKPAGRRVVLLDDMLDKGNTAAFTASHFIENHGAAIVDLAALTIKQTDRAACFEDFPGEVIGCFDVPDVWVVGMGMDDARVADEAHRWLPYLAVASEA